MAWGSNSTSTQLLVTVLPAEILCQYRTNGSKTFGRQTDSHPPVGIGLGALFNQAVQLKKSDPPQTRRFLEGTCLAQPLDQTSLCGVRSGKELEQHQPYMVTREPDGKMNQAQPVSAKLFFGRSGEVGRCMNLTPTIEGSSETIAPFSRFTYNISNRFRSMSGHTHRPWRTACRT